MRIMNKTQFTDTIPIEKIPVLVNGFMPIEPMELIWLINNGYDVTKVDTSHISEIIVYDVDIDYLYLMHKESAFFNNSIDLRAVLHIEKHINKNFYTYHLLFKKDGEVYSHSIDLDKIKELKEQGFLDVVNHEKTASTKTKLLQMITPY